MEIKCEFSNFNDSLEQFRMLIKAQDLVRQVYCRQTGNLCDNLRDLDKIMSKIINQHAQEKGIVSVSGTSKTY